MVFCFVQKFFIGQHKSQNIFFLSRNARNIFPEFNIRLYDKNSQSDYFFFPPPKSEYFFQQHWVSEYFFRKKTYPPPLQVKWSLPYKYHFTMLPCFVQSIHHTSICRPKNVKKHTMYKTKENNRKTANVSISQYKKRKNEIKSVQ